MRRNDARCPAALQTKRTPLHLAAAAGNLKMVKLLADHHPDFFLKDSNGKMARELAEEGGFPEVAAAVQKGMDAAHHTLI